MYPIEKFIGKYMPEEPVIIEAGSHDAGDTLYMNHVWPRAKIYTFEPNPYWHPTIRQRIAPFSNISFYPIALGDHVGTIDFYESLRDKGGGDCTVKPILSDYFWTDMLTNAAFAPPVKVPVMTLDAWAEQNHIDHVDFMWLDMEGSEGKMFLGSERLLKKTRIIQTEWSERTLYEGEMPFAELHNFLTDRGFVCSCVSKKTNHKKSGARPYFLK